MNADPLAIEALMREVRRALASSLQRPVIIGLCGAQGSGKSTLAKAVSETCGQAGISAAVLSLDDLYLTRAEREGLASDVHPLLLTRGVPGTHDVAFGLALLGAMKRGEPVRLPRFDKAQDDRCPESEWFQIAAGCEVLIFEGWCVGARSQERAELELPVNQLERTEDASGDWRDHVNQALGGAYQALFSLLDRLVLLAAPNFEVVHGWRLEQEQALAAQDRSAGAFMDAAAIARFVAHYERLTRHILAEMPRRADLVVQLDACRRIVAMHRGNHM